MKKLIYSLILFLTLSTTVSSVSAADNKKPKTELTAAEKAELEHIKSRVEEIRSMDKSKLTRTEKRALRKELKELKKRAAFLDQGVYLSVGAIIIILLVLILIL